MTEQETSPALKLLLEDDMDGPAPEPSPTVKHRVWFPRWLAATIKYYLLPFTLLELWTEKMAKKIVKPPYKRVGSCKKRGACCHYIMLPSRKGIVGRLAYWWYTQIHGFYPRFSDEKWYYGKKVRVMGCSYLKKDGSCRQYKTRPVLCRKWPFIERFAHPEVLRGCGFTSDPPMDHERYADGEKL